MMSPERTEPQIDHNIAEQIPNPSAKAAANPIAWQPTMPGMFAALTSAESKSKKVHSRAEESKADRAEPGAPLQADGPATSVLTQEPFDPPAGFGATEPGGRVGRILGGRYRLEERVGCGAMGEVFRALDLRCRRRYAVKLVHPDAPRDLRADRRFWNEAQMAARLHHPNIVSWSEFNRDADGTDFMVLELLEGQDLGELLEQSGKLPLRRVMDIVRSVGSALQYAHDLGIVHRDIKPENIFLSQHHSAQGASYEVVKILDFGLAKLFREESTAAGGTQAGADRRLTQGIAVGTPAYVPPEIIMGSAVIDGRADQWALGVVIYQLLSGKQPFEHRTTLGLCQLICTVDPVPISDLVPDLPSHVSRAVARALNKNPAARFDRIHDFVRALDDQPAIWGVPAEPAPLAHGAALRGTISDVPTQPALPNRASAGERPATRTDTLGSVDHALRASTSLWIHPEDLSRRTRADPNSERRNAAGGPNAEDLRQTVQYSADELFALAGQVVAQENPVPAALAEETPTTPYGLHRPASATPQGAMATPCETAPMRETAVRDTAVRETTDGDSGSLGLAQPVAGAQTVLLKDAGALTQRSTERETHLSLSHAPAMLPASPPQHLHAALPGMTIPMGAGKVDAWNSIGMAQVSILGSRLHAWPTSDPETAPRARAPSPVGMASYARWLSHTPPRKLMLQLISAGSALCCLVFLVAFLLGRHQ